MTRLYAEPADFRSVETTWARTLTIKGLTIFQNRKANFRNFFFFFIILALDLIHLKPSAFFLLRIFKKENTNKKQKKI